VNSQPEIVLESSVSILQKQLELLRSENAFLKQQLADLKRMIFGSKSERFIPTDDGQLNMFSELAPQEVKQEVLDIPGHTRVKEKQKPVRNLLPAHLPRVEEIIEPEDKEVDSIKIGEEVTELLEYNPGKVYVRRIVRPKYKLATNERIVVADLPKLPIPKGNAGAGLLAHIQVSKWVDHLPYYRQIAIFKREGVSLSESTIGGWFAATCDLLQPLYDKLVNEVKNQAYLQADESPIKVLEGSSDKKAKNSQTGYHWVYYAPEKRLVVFDYQPNRSRKGPEMFLQNFEGVLQTDGYAAYNEFAQVKGITLLACMAHARRYFEKALDNDKARASYALSVIKELYAIERSAKEDELDYGQIASLRQEESTPILKNFKLWLDDNLNQTTPKSAIGKAISYTLKLWTRIEAYTSDGKYNIDNNPIVNTIRPLALGRKNYLFAGSHQGAKRAAMMYSFFATCKMHEVEPFAWLKDVLNRIPEHKINKIEELLPQNWIIQNS